MRAKVHDVRALMAVSLLMSRWRRCPADDGGGAAKDHRGSSVAARDRELVPNTGSRCGRPISGYLPSPHHQRSRTPALRDEDNAQPVFTRHAPVQDRTIDPVRRPSVGHYGVVLRPLKKKITANTRPTRNRTQAIFVAAPAIPEKPRSPAIIATTRKINAHWIMLHLVFPFKKSLRHHVLGSSWTCAPLHLRFTGPLPLRRAGTCQQARDGPTQHLGAELDSNALQPSQAHRSGPLEPVWVARRGIKHHSQEFCRARSVLRDRGHEMPPVHQAVHCLPRPWASRVGDYLLLEDSKDHRDHGRKCRNRACKDAVTESACQTESNGEGHCLRRTTKCAGIARPIESLSATHRRYRAAQRRSHWPGGFAAKARGGSGAAHRDDGGHRTFRARARSRAVGDSTAAIAPRSGAPTRRASDSRGPYCLHPASCRKIADGPMMLRH